MLKDKTRDTPLYEDEESRLEMLSFKPKKRGKPAFNIFVERAKARGEKSPAYNPKIVHICVKCKQKQWLNQFVKARHEVSKNRATNKRFAWSKVIHAWGGPLHPI